MISVEGSHNIKDTRDIVTQPSGSKFIDYKPSIDTKGNDDDELSSLFSSEASESIEDKKDVVIHQLFSEVINVKPSSDSEKPKKMYGIKSPHGKVIDAKGIDNKKKIYADSSSESTPYIRNMYVGNKESEEIIKEVTMSDTDSSNRCFMIKFLIQL